MKYLTKAVFMVYALVLGGISAGVVWVFLFAAGEVYELLWVRLLGFGMSAASGGFNFAPLVVCTCGGLLIGLWQKYAGEGPETLEKVLASVKTDGGYRYKGLWKMVITAFLPIALGGCIGPEAGLTGVIAGLCTWIGDHFKYAGGKMREAASVGLSASLTTIFGAPLFGLLAPFEAQDDSIVIPKKSKVALYLASVFGGLAVMAGLSMLAGGAGLPRFEGVEWTRGDVLLSIPVAVAGVLLGLIYHCAAALWSRINGLFKGRLLIVRTLICGAALGTCGIFLPLTLFSGEAQMEVVMESYAGIGAMILLITAPVKLIATAMCTNLGWRGGNIFPVIFAGVSAGYGVALLSGMEPVLCVSVVTAALCGAVMRKPVMTIAVLILCFPVKNIVFLGIASVIGSLIPLPFVRGEAKG